MRAEEWLKQEVEKLGYTASVKYWGITINKCQSKFNIDVICDYSFKPEELEFYDNALPVAHIKQFITIIEEHKKRKEEE